MAGFTNEKFPRLTETETEIERLNQNHERYIHDREHPRDRDGLPHNNNDILDECGTPHIADEPNH